jgi:hypothetical protein
MSRCMLHIFGVDPACVVLHAAHLLCGFFLKGNPDQTKKPPGQQSALVSHAAGSGDTLRLHTNRVS